SNPSGYRGPSQKFTSNGRGFQAQQQRDSNQGYNNFSSANPQRRPPPLGERRMTHAERDKYQEQ
ncbi:unnamed protein product, partial [Ilex paraguariensis]